MSRIRTYITYTEVTNGLFVDIENEKPSITKNDIEEVLKSVVAGADVINSSDREIVIYSSAEGLRQFNRAMQEGAYRQSEIIYVDPSIETREEEVRRASNEGIWHQLRNMSERETIEYLDRISEEQENEQHNSTI